MLPADGATNMAIDEAIMLVMAERGGVPTLRFYGWEPPCLSLGYSQGADDVDEEACRALGYTWVRRPTGGSAILHVDELTYSIAAPEGEPRVRGGVIESYRRLSEGLLLGLRGLGADVVQARRERPAGGDAGSRRPACFDSPSDYEITSGGRKLVGSAQVRRRGMVLQHGSLPLCGDMTRIFGCLKNGDDGQARDLKEHSCTLEEVLGRVVGFDEAADALEEGFCGALNLELLPGELTGDELSLARELVAGRYGHDSWNRRV